MDYDILVIGGGVSGACVARELSRYRLRVALTEAASDLAKGSSGANSAIIHAGFDCKPNSMMARLNVLGNAMYEPLCAELHVPFERNGSLVLAFSEDERPQLEELFEQGRANGVPGLEIWERDRVLAHEPFLNPEIVAALWAPSGGIVCPYEFTLAMAENAYANGVDFYMNNPVTGLQFTDDVWEITAPTPLRARWIINAAGVFADDLARMMGEDCFDIVPRKGEYHLQDRTQGDKTTSTIFQVPGPMGKGVLVTKTVDGNLIIGPSAVDGSDRYDVSTSAGGLEEVVRMARRSVPSIDTRATITTFSGIRAVSGNDFIIRRSHAAQAIHVAGICSPGLSSAPAFGLEVVALLQSAGVQMCLKENFISERSHDPEFRHADWPQRAELMEQNPLYGRIVCRCETVTEAEVVAALKRPLCPPTLDGIKRRTRAGMGRCQGGFCTPRIMEIIARERNLDFSQITKHGGDSWLVTRRESGVEE